MMNEMKTGIYTYNDNSHSFNFRTSLSAHDKAIFVRTVVDTIIDDINYDSVLRDLIFDYTVISMMTDIDISFLKTTDNNGNTITDIDKLEDFLLSTNIIEIVEVNAFPTLFDELNKAVNLSIQHRTGITPSPLSDALSSLLSTLERKINEVDLDSMMGMAQKFAGMSDEFTIDNLVNAYMNSDMHKKNLEEIEDAKTDRTMIDEIIDEAIREVNEEAKAKAKTGKKK